MRYLKNFPLTLELLLAVIRLLPRNHFRDLPADAILHTARFDMDSDAFMLCFQHPSFVSPVTNDVRCHYGVMDAPLRQRRQCSR